MMHPLSPVPSHVLSTSPLRAHPRPRRPCAHASASRGVTSTLRAASAPSTPRASCAPFCGAAAAAKALIPASPGERRARAAQGGTSAKTARGEVVGHKRCTRGTQGCWWERFSSGVAAGTPRTPPTHPRLAPKTCTRQGGRGLWRISPKMETSRSLTAEEKEWVGKFRSHIFNDRRASRLEPQSNHDRRRR